MIHFKLLRKCSVFVACGFISFTCGVFVLKNLIINPRQNNFGGSNHPSTHKFISYKTTTVQNLSKDEEERVYDFMPTPWHLIIFLSKHIQLVDISGSSHVKLPTSFCVFENEVSFLKTALFRDSIARSKYLMYIIKNVDPRRLRIWRNESRDEKIIGHILLTNLLGDIIHLKVLVPRNDYFWISELDTQKAKRIVGEIPIKTLRSFAIAIDGCFFHNMTVKYVEKIRLFSPSEIKTFKWHMEKSSFIECDFERRIWLFWDLYSDIYEYYDKSLIVRALKFFREKSLEHRIPLQLNGGTLLGWYRQCDFIPYSKDIDFVTNVSFITEKFFRDLWNSKKFQLRQRFGTKKEGLEITGQYETDLKVDIFSWTYDKGQMFTYLYFWDSMLVKRLGYRVQTKLCTCDLLGQLTYVSCDPLQMLNDEYDYTWFEPKQSTMSKNYVQHRQYESTEIDEFSKVYHFYELANCTNPKLIFGCDN